MNSCQIQELEEALKDPACQIIDVREPSEYRSEHIEGTLSLPLSNLEPSSSEKISRDKKIYLVCRSGIRAGKAAQKLTEFGYQNLRVVEGGMQAWIGAGKPVLKAASGVWSLDRQVRFTAGSLTLTGILLAHTVHPYFIALPIFIAGGLVFSAITDTCGMGMLLAKMPWNRTGL